jgi:hypothetical protein
MADFKVHFDSLQAPETGNFDKLFSTKLAKKIWKTKLLDDKT